MQAESARLQPLTPGTWFVWVAIALTATIIGSVAIARAINRPLQNLSRCAATGRARPTTTG